MDGERKKDRRKKDKENERSVEMIKIVPWTL